SGQRRTQLRAPVETAEDALEAIAAVGDFVVGAEQTARDGFALVRSFAGSGVAVADGQFAEHPADDAVEIAAGAQVRQKRSVLLADGGPVGAVHGRIVEVIAVDAPGFVENLRPFGARLDTNFDGLDIEPAFGRRPRNCGSSGRRPA